MSDRHITSVSNPRVKDVARLRDRKHRDARQEFLIDGARELLRALAKQAAITEAFVCDSLVHTDEAREAIAQLHELNVSIWQVTPAVFAKLAFGERAEGVVAVASQMSLRLENLKLDTAPLVAILEGVEKPGNVGADFRSADAAGVSALGVAEGGTDLFNPNTIRASLGTIFTVPTVAARSAEALAWARSQKLTLVAARPDASRLYHEVDLTGPVAIVLGSEAHGLGELWSAPDILPVRVPMLGIADSLNVSATAAVLFYEALRQRTRAERG